jgi:hypothetical protein
MKEILKEELMYMKLAKKVTECFDKKDGEDIVM